MLRSILFAVSLCLFSCQPVDPLIGTMPCEDRCMGGCCAGDPQNAFTECVMYDWQNDQECGSRGERCDPCPQYESHTEPGKLIRLHCVYSDPYQINMCATE